MTVSEQIELLASVNEDMDLHKDLYTRFEQTVSTSPISGSRETEIVAEYLDLVESLKLLYVEVINAVATWLTQQP